ncbi:carbohydrate ABC transporter permease [Bogoriella caseilytica]|nr:sugar ABC transporter permease [Bogoriella caseilytica]
MSETTMGPAVDATRLPQAPGGAAQRRGSGAAGPLERRRNRANLMLLLPAVLFIGLFLAYPLGYGIYMSLVDFTSGTFLTGEAPFVGFANYAEAIGSAHFGRALRNTLLITIVSLAIQMSGGLLLALYFQRDFPGSRWMSTVLLLPWLVPLIITATTWRWMLQGNGIINQLLAGIGIDGPSWLADSSWAIWAIIGVNTWAGLPFMATILGAALRNVPHELEEAATLDGAGYWRRLWSITLPQIMPVMLVMTILGIIATLKVLDLVLALTGGGPANSTQTLALLSYDSSFRHFNFGVGAAFGNVLLVVTIIIAAVYAWLSRREEAN